MKRLAEQRDEIGNRKHEEELMIQRAKYHLLKEKVDEVRMLSPRRNEKKEPLMLNKNPVFITV